MNSSKEDAQKLPAREHANFQKLIKYYDSKQFNPALSEAKTILKKFPNHGETISMKALITFALGKRDEADKLAKEGLRNNFKSATCWHVIGILETKRKNHEKAISAHVNALKHEPQNYIVLRDLASLQHVLRKYGDYRNTRADMIPIKSSANLSWVSFALANYHCGSVNYSSPEAINEQQKEDFGVAIEILETMVDSLKSQKSEAESAKDPAHRYDISETYLFLAYLLILQGQFEKALDHLDKREPDIVDSETFRELKGMLYLKLAKFDLAQREYTWLISRNPENYEYYQAFEAIIRPATVDDRLKMYDIINSRFPRAIAGKRLILDFLPADHSEFEARLKAYLVHSIKKGRPALFQDMKSFYRNVKSGRQGSPEKVLVIGKVMGQLLAETAGSSGSSAPSESECDSSCYPWVCYYLTKHYTNQEEHEKAMKAVNRGIDHTPTLVELYVVKAKVYRKLGQLAKAVELIIEAQELDTADRFTNCIACKYLISNNEVARAEKMLAKFVKDSKEIGDYLRELQTLWFETEVIKVSYHQGNYGETLRRCHLVKRIYSDMFEDQFDFVQYCMRKHTMSSFADFMTFEDALYSNTGYQLAAYYACLVYFKLLDVDIETNDKENGQTHIINSLTNEQLAKSEEIKAKQLALESKMVDDDGWGPKKEQILDPVELVRNCKPLEEIEDFLDKLEAQSGKSTLTHYLSLELYSKRKNFARSIKAIYKGCTELSERWNNTNAKGENKNEKVKFSSNLSGNSTKFTTSFIPLICLNTETHLLTDAKLQSEIEERFLARSRKFINEFDGCQEEQLLACSLKYLFEELEIKTLVESTEGLYLVKKANSTKI